MKIECILHRDGGTVVELPGQTYHFAPQDDGRHVADVTIEAHIERFLSIPEAYRLPRATGADAAAAIFEPKSDAPIAPAGDVPLLVSEGYHATYEIDGKTYDIKAITQRAFQDSGLTAENWNELPEDTRAIKLDSVLDGIADGVITDVEPVTEPEPEGQPQESRAELSKQYQDKFGKRPPNTMSLESIKAKLATDS